MQTSSVSHLSWNTASVPWLWSSVICSWLANTNICVDFNSYLNSIWVGLLGHVLPAWQLCRGRGQCDGWPGGGVEILKPYLIFFFLLKCQLSWLKKWTGDGRLFSWLLWMRFLSKSFIFLTILETSKRLPAHYHWNCLNLILKFMVAFCLWVLLLRTIAIGKIVYAAGPLHVTRVLRLSAKLAIFPKGIGDDLLLAAGNWKSSWDQSIDRNCSLPSPQVSHLFTGLTGDITHMEPPLNN